MALNFPPVDSNANDPTNGLIWTSPMAISGCTIQVSVDGAH